MAVFSGRTVLSALGRSGGPIDSCIFLQCVRWRKPVHTKINASKLFYVRKKGEEPALPKHEFEAKMAAYERSVSSLRY
jgi:hypothetical protein